MKKQSYIVKLRCTVIKEIITGVCTEEEAHEDPLGACEAEDEKSIEDWEVLSVEPNV